ncbi:MAG: MBL fold metallo-hydrolase [Smithella sp.]|nr:MBL fold metallo-hydrolase [Smithella sp.]
MQYINKIIWFSLLFLLSGSFLGSWADAQSLFEDDGGYESRYEDTIFGRRFLNVEPVKHHNAWDMVKWFVTGKREKWPAEIQNEPGDKPPDRVKTGIRYMVVNHATVLIQVDGVNILTDPIWSERASWLPWIGPKRVVSPGIAFEDLPPIDIVLISHNHYDHMDMPTLVRVAKRDNPLFVAGIGNQRTLKRSGIHNVTGLDWWQGITKDGIEIYFAPARHFSRRGVADYNMSLWGGFVIKAPDGVIYFLGDSGYGSFIREVRKRFGPVDLAFIPIGAYEPRWMMETIHLTPEEAFDAHQDLDSKLSVGIHFGTFQLTDESIDEPRERLNNVIRQNSKSRGRFVVPTFGKSVEVKKND